MCSLIQMKFSIAHFVLLVSSFKADPIKREIAMLGLKALLAASPLFALMFYQIVIPQSVRRRDWSAFVEWLWPVQWPENREWPPDQT